MFLIWPALGASLAMLVELVTGWGAWVYWTLMILALLPGALFGWLAYDQHRGVPNYAEPIAGLIVTAFGCLPLLLACFNIGWTDTMAAAVLHESILPRGYYLVAAGLWVAVAATFTLSVWFPLRYGWWLPPVVAAAMWGAVMWGLHLGESRANSKLTNMVHPTTRRTAGGVSDMVTLNY